MASKSVCRSPRNDSDPSGIYKTIQNLQKRLQRIIETCEVICIGILVHASLLVNQCVSACLLLAWPLFDRRQRQGNNSIPSDSGAHFKIMSGHLPSTRLGAGSGVTSEPPRKVMTFDQHPKIAKTVIN